MRVNLVHWNSLHSKKAILPTFSGLTSHFLCENHKARTYNLHHRKAWSVAVILSLRGQTDAKSGAINCTTRWQYNVHCILQGLLTLIALNLQTLGWRW